MSEQTFWIVFLILFSAICATLHFKDRVRTAEAEAEYQALERDRAYIREHTLVKRRD